jgi:hypothetical protein
MSWTPDGPYGGFSSCNSSSCIRRLSPYKNNPPKTSVKVNFVQIKTRKTQTENII